jgi:transposase-like protein
MPRSSQATSVGLELVGAGGLLTGLTKTVLETALEAEMKRQRRLDSIDEIVLSLMARGLTTGEICAHFADVYGASVSKDTVSRITDKVVEETTGW